MGATAYGMLTAGWSISSECQPRSTISKIECRGAISAGLTSSVNLTTRPLDQYSRVGKHYRTGSWFWSEATYLGDMVALDSLDILIHG